LDTPNRRETVTIASEGDRSVEIALQADIVKLGRFVVGGEREGQARALQQKRTADNIIDVVSADSAGKLPDGNAAEAVRRLPGVFAEIDQNEGRYIVVRGIDSALNNITIDGISVGSTESGTRGAAMDSVPADLIAHRGHEGGHARHGRTGVGASVNIVTPSAFDRQDTFRLRHRGRGLFQRARGEDRRSRPTAPAAPTARPSATASGG
jgi:outer membrane cobalamin receptor